MDVWLFVSEGWMNVWIVVQIVGLILSELTYFYKAHINGIQCTMYDGIQCTPGIEFKLTKFVYCRFKKIEAMQKNWQKLYSAQTCIFYIFIWIQMCKTYKSAFLKFKRYARSKGGKVKSFQNCKVFTNLRHLTCQASVTPLLCTYNIFSI